jgi:hypothetical protein
MAYAGLAFPGLELSMKAVNRERAKIMRWLKTLEDNPKLFKQPKRVRDKYERMLADLDTGMRVLRDAQKAAERPKRVQTKSRKLSVQRGRRLNELDPGPIDSAQ